MTMINHPWRQRLLASLPAEKIAAKISDECPLWEEIDNNIAKLGSLTHGQVDIPRLQELCLTLLEEESKDFRICIHLLRTLQHSGNPDGLVLACSLLNDYMNCYAGIAWPQDKQVSSRLLQQVFRRFDSAAVHFSKRADEQHRQQMRQALTTLLDSVSSLDEKRAADVRQLMTAYERVSDPDTTPLPATTQETTAAVPNIPANIEIRSDSERAWRQSLLDVAERLCETHPADPVGYLLRRHAIWSTINSLPPTKEGFKTQLAAVAADRTADYRRRIASDPSVWKEIETSVTLAPWWFDGHYLSASIALQNGYHAVANAIRESINRFLEKVPGAEILQFSDGSPFVSKETAAWLENDAVSPMQNGGGRNDEAVWQEYHSKGLQAALCKLNNVQQSTPGNDPRIYFYNQLTTAQLLAEDGLSDLSQHQYATLWKSIRTLSLEEWEPSLITFIKKNITDASQGLE